MLRPRILALGTGTVAINAVGAAADYGSPNTVYQITFSFNCDNPTVSIGPFWAGRRLAGTSSFAGDLTWVSERGLLLIRCY